MRLGIRGSGGVLGRAVAARAAALEVSVVALGRDDEPTLDALVWATPADAWRPTPGVPSIAPAVRQADTERPVDVPAGGFWGGIGTLLAGVATEEAASPTEVHVAYGFPGARRVLTRASGTLRTALLRAAVDEGTARIDGERASEPLGQGRRLAWFPAPVGPAHAVAVAGLEHLAPITVPTVRTWLAAGSMGAELLQAVGRLEVDRGLGRWLHRRAATGGGGPAATEDVRWAVVVEALDRDGTIVRAWANGTDPVAAAADLLVLGAQRLAGTAVPPPSGTLLDLGPPEELLDRLADLRTLRWSVSRPEPSRR